MAGNDALHKAAIAKKDEFYTQLSDIENELRHYKKHFKGKTVFCNCDDPFESNFFKFFAMNFNSLGLKKLIATCYAGSPVTGNEIEYYIDESGQLSFLDFPNTKPAKNKLCPYRVEITEVKDENGDGRIDLADVEYLIKNKKNIITLLEGDGDFRSEECIDLLKQADIVCTNPPFSLFREYVAQLIEYNKSFLIIGNQNAITYKEIFPLIKDNKIWLGYKAGDMSFKVPEYYEERATRFWIDDSGQKWRSMGNICWYTNLDIAKRHEDLLLFKHYYGNEQDYPKYDNYDAINVNKVADIPCDYFEDMGVPITYLDKHNPDQFDVIKFRKGNDGKDLTYTVDSEDNSVREEKRREEKRREEKRREEKRREEKNYALLQNHHQTQEDVTELWEFQSHSSINTTLNNSSLSEQLKAKERVSQTDCGMNQAESRNLLSTKNESISDCLSRGRCSGVMGVPITFLDRYNPEQFEILGINAGRDEFECRPTKRYINPIQHNKNGTVTNGSKANTRSTLVLENAPSDNVYYTADNCDKPFSITYARIFIKRK